MKPLISPSTFSMETFTQASSPKTDFAYRLAARKPHSPSEMRSAGSEALHVRAIHDQPYGEISEMFVFSATLFSHSNSAHIFLNAVSLHVAR